MAYLPSQGHVHISQTIVMIQVSPEFVDHFKSVGS